MDDVETSWVRRAKFSHTVCHRIDMSRISSVPFTFEPRTLGSTKIRPQLVAQNPIPKPDEPRTLASVKSRPQFVTQNAIPHQAHRNPMVNRERAISPHPQTKLSDSFKEARSIQKRFSTPNPQRKDEEKGKFGKLFHRDCKECKAPKSKSAPLMQTSMKSHDKSRNRRESSWAKYFEYGGGRVTSVETVDDDHLVDLEKLFLGEKFAHGAHSQLYHGVYMDEPVAVKMIRVPDNDENIGMGCMLQKHFTREVTLLSRLQHQNVLKFLAACRKEVFFIVTEYMSKGSLRSHLHKLEKKCIPLRKLIAMALDIARGMEYIHSQGIVHRDLKPENILIADDFHLIIADFGIACEEACCEFLADDPGTYRWMAPEMIKRKKYGRKVDVYGFGLILWEFVTGTIPYEDMTPIQAAFAVVNKNLRPCIPGDCPIAIKVLIEQCWSLQPDKRPEFWQIVKVLEEFDSSLARDGTLNLVQNSICHDDHKGLRYWIHKLKPNH